MTVRLQLPFGAALQFPTRLRSLDLTLEAVSPKSGREGAGLAAPFNAALDAVVDLAQLEEFTLHVTVPVKEWTVPGSLAALVHPLQRQQLLGLWILTEADVALLPSLSPRTLAPVLKVHNCRQNERTSTSTAGALS